MTTADDLKSARAIVATRWHKGGLTDGGDNLCLLGALAVSCSGRITKIDGQHAISLGHPDLHARFTEASRLLVNRLPGPHEYLGSYNDHPDTTREDVITLFDKALAELGEL